MVTVNDRPTVSITISSAAYKVGYSVTASASASDPDGSIAKVQFYKNNTLAETVSKQPYSYRASRSTVGSDRFHAVATDDDGGTGTSNTAIVTWSDPKVLIAIWANDHTPDVDQKITIAASTAATGDFLNPWVGIYNLGRGDMIGDLGNYPAIEDLQKSGDSAYSDTISGSYTIPAATPLGLYTFRADFQDASGQRGVAWLVVDVGGQSANPPPTYQPPSATSTPPGSLPPYDDPLYGDPLYGPADDQPPTSPSPTSPPPNRPPTVTLRTVDSKIPQNGSTTLIATASDLDGRIVTYAFFRDGTEMQSGQSDYHIYNHPIVGRRQFTVTVTDDRGAQATSEAVTIDVTGSSGPVMPVGQWADVNGDGIYDQVLATIKLQRDLSLQSVSNGMSAKIFKRTYVTQNLFVPFSFGISLFNDNDWGSSFGLFDFGLDLSFTIDEWYMACVRIPSSLTPRGFDYQLQYRAFTNAWVSTGPAFPGSIGGIGYCPDTLAEEVIDWLPEFIRFVRLLNKSSEVGAPIMTDVNGDGVDDRVQQVSVEVITADNGNGDMIISVECSEGSDCGTPVIKRNGEWSDAEDNKDVMEIVRPEDPDYPEGISPGERAKQVFRVIANACWGDDPRPGAKVVNLVNCLPIGYVDLGFAMIGVDNDRDGHIFFSWPLDRATRWRPYRFWINNDMDGTNWSYYDHPWNRKPDHRDKKIQSNRDLEDFTRLHLRVLGYLDGLQAGTIKATLKFRPGTVVGKPAIRLYRNLHAFGGLGYLDNVGLTTQKMVSTESLGKVTASVGYTFPKEFWNDGRAIKVPYLPHNLDRYLLFEGTAEGKGELILEFKSDDGILLGWGRSSWIRLLDVRHMYLRATALPVGPIIPDPHLWFFETPALTPTIPVRNPLGYPYRPDLFEDAIYRRYIVFVHGWRLADRDVQSYGITMFKRLWWAGYKGRFAVFRWPTYDFETGLDNIVIVEGLEVYLSKYNESEYRAWRSGMALMLYIRALQGKEALKSLAPLDGLQVTDAKRALQILQDLEGFKNVYEHIDPIKVIESLQELLSLADLFGGYSVNLVAHSMGNVVVASALETGIKGIDNYALLQASIPAAYYDTSELLKQQPREQEIDPPILDRRTYRAWDVEPIGEDPVAAIAALGYKGWGSGVSGRLINFSLPDDYATRDAWEYNNSAVKPWNDGAFGTGEGKTLYYRYNRQAPVNEKIMLQGKVLNFGKGILLPIKEDIYRQVKHSHEAMSMVAQSKTKSVGAEPRTRGGIDGTVNLGEGSIHEFEDEHSAEFTRDIQQVRAFYNELRTQLLTPATDQ